MRVFSVQTWRLHRTILSNASSLVASWAITSALGALFWLVAARTWSTEAVGIASAAVAAMTLLGAVATIGLNTLLMGRLAEEPRNARSMISTSLLLTLAVGGVLGALFAVFAPLLSGQLDPIGADAWAVAVFALGVGVTAVCQVLDQALIGLFQGGVQLWRNFAFAFLKLVLIAVVGIFLATRSGMDVFAVWVLGAVLSLVAVSWRPLRRSSGLAAFRPRLQALRGWRLHAAEHHVFNLALKAPSMALPVIVTALLSAEVNAGFYVATMIAGLIYVIPGSLTTVLYAIGSSQPAEFRQKAGLTMRLSLLVTAVSAGVVLIAAGPIMRIFGSAYADAAWSLRILSLAAFPLVVKVHYATVRRMAPRIGRAIPLVIVGTALEVAFAVAGAEAWGLNGLSIGWALALCAEAIVMLPEVRRSTSGTPDVQAWPLTAESAELADISASKSLRQQLRRTLTTATSQGPS